MLRDERSCRELEANDSVKFHARVMVNYRYNKDMTV